MWKPILIAAVLGGVAATPPAAAQSAEPESAPREPGARWSIALAGGALAPVGEMRDGYQDALVAGLRVAVRARIGLGIQLAVDYSPLPRRAEQTETFDTTYGTVALIPAWTLGRGTVRVQLGAGGGLAAEHTSITGAAATTSLAPAAIAQLGLEIHVTRGGGLVLLGGATRTFGEQGYQYGWALGGLTLEF